MFKRPKLHVFKTTSAAKPKAPRNTPNQQGIFSAKHTWNSDSKQSSSPTVTPIYKVEMISLFLTWTPTWDSPYSPSVHAVGAHSLTHNPLIMRVPLIHFVHFYPLCVKKKNKSTLNLLLRSIHKPHTGVTSVTMEYSWRIQYRITRKQRRQQAQTTKPTNNRKARSITIVYLNCRKKSVPSI